jgi:S-adenosylmethionine hydrolase
VGIVTLLTDFGHDNRFVGSSGYLEIAVNRGSARDTVDIHEGGEFILKVL